MNYFESNVFLWIVLPLLIMLARIVDVSMGTLRIILVSKGVKLIASVLGFFEVLIWLLAISQIMQNLSNWICYIAYGIGFAIGTYVGIMLENKLSMGVQLIRIISKTDAAELIGYLRNADYGITVIDAQGATGPVNIIYTIIRRKNLKNVISIIEKFNPRAFYTIEDLRFVREGLYPVQSTEKSNSMLKFIKRK